MDAGHANVVLVLAAVDKLDPHDTAYLRAPTEAVMLLEKIANTLGATAKTAYDARLAARP
jgi:hypothetical protein